MAWWRPINSRAHFILSLVTRHLSPQLCQRPLDVFEGVKQPGGRVVFLDFVFEVGGVLELDLFGRPHDFDDRRRAVAEAAVAALGVAVAGFYVQRAVVVVVGAVEGERGITRPRS